MVDAVEKMVGDSQDTYARGRDIDCEFTGAGTESFAHGLGRAHRGLLMGVPRASAAVTVFEPLTGNDQPDTHFRLTASAACIIRVRAY